MKKLDGKGMTRVIVMLGLLLAVNILLDRFISIQTPIVRLSFGFLPIAMAGSLFGPVAAGAVGALGDILRMILFPTGSGYFPGFTVTALLGGVIYGLFLYKKQATVLRVALAVLTVSIICDMGLNTLWLYIMMGQGGAALIVPRLIKAAVMYPVQVFLIYSMLKVKQLARLGSQV